MKATVFCILCLVVGVVVSANADHQMKQETAKEKYCKTLAYWHPDCNVE